MKYVAPMRGVKAFTCPFCGVLTTHASYSVDKTLGSANHHTAGDPIATTVCSHCNKFTLWYGETLVAPNHGSAPPPNDEMPDDVRKEYEEAAAISRVSPRGAAAILRLALQRLCRHLGGTGANINDDIAMLVDRGLSTQVQRALDLVRVVGNNAVHPGQIDTDNPAVVAGLFEVLNVIVESMIVVPKRIDEMYSALPVGALKAIERRDEPKGSG